jgi:hypothetical protein
VGCGGPATIEIDIDLKEPLQNATFTVSFVSDRGHRVLGLGSRMEMRGVDLAPGRRTVRCHVDALMLKPGRYVLDVHLRSHSKPYDIIESAAAVDVEFDDYYETGEMLWGDEGSVLHRSSWEI